MVGKKKRIQIMIIKRCSNKFIRERDGERERGREGENASKAIAKHRICTYLLLPQHYFSLTTLQCNFMWNQIKTINTIKQHSYIQRKVSISKSIDYAWIVEFFEKDSEFFSS